MNPASTSFPYFPQIDAAETKSSRYVTSNLPAVLVNLGSMMVPFMQAYYEWMEEDGGIGNDIKNLLNYQDFKKTPDRFLQYLMEEFLPSIPANVIADKRLLLLHAKEFYISRGTEQSFKFLFNILFNQNVDISYPKEKILRTSSSTWTVQTVMKVKSFNDNILGMANRRIYGLESSAIALVESISFQYVGADKIAVLVISDKYGDFQIDEAISTTTENPNLPGLYGRVYGTVSKAVITSAGVGYTVGSIIPISSDGDGTGVYAVIETVDINGGILKIRIVDGGIEYIHIPPTPNIGGMSGMGADFSFDIAASFTEAGYFADDQGMLSSSMVIQDSKVYQEYSYVLTSSVQTSLYLDTVKKLLHPAGFYLSSVYVEPEYANLVSQNIPMSRSVTQVDDMYPDGIPSTLSFLRVFKPEALTVLPTGLSSEITIE